MSEEIVGKSLIRKTAPEINVHDYGKLPPQHKELEEAVLGALMIENNSIVAIEPIFREQAFYIDSHQRICRAILTLRKDKHPIDLLTVTEQLKKTGELDASGGPFYIAQLTNKVGSAANIEYHYRLILEAYIKRSAILMSTEIIKDAYDDETDAFDLIQQSANGVKELEQIAVTGNSVPLEFQIDEAAVRINEMASGVNSKFIIKSNHSAINKNIGGWVKGCMTIVAARPGMGKSSWLISELYFLLKSGKRVLCFNLEMTKEQFFIRLWCLISGVTNTRVKSGNMNDFEREQWKLAIEWTKRMAHLMTLYFRGGMDIEEIEAIIRLVSPDVTFIDHLQFVKNKTASKRVQQKLVHPT